MKKLLRTTLWCGVLSFIGLAASTPAQADIYIIGEPSTWKVDPSWVITSQNNDGIYTGTYNIPSGKFQFRFMEHDAVSSATDPTWNETQYGIQAGDSPVSISFSYGLYASSIVSGKGQWKVDNWSGGNVTITLNTINNTVQFSTQVYDPITYPDKLYLVGKPNNWAAGNSTITLAQTDNNTGVYSGKLTIKGNEFSFRFFTQLDSSWNPAYQIGAGCKDQDDVDFKFTDNQYTGTFYFPNGQSNWSCGDWVEEGDVTVTVDLPNQTITFETEQEVEQLEPKFEDQIYVIGNMNNWNFEESSFVLNKTDEKVYSGDIELDASTEPIYFRFYTVLGNDVNYSYGPEFDNTTLNFEDNNTVNSTLNTKGNNGWSKNNWILPSWNGGKLGITVNFNDNTVVFSNSEESTDKVYPENLYLAGNFNEWSDSNEDYKLTSSEQGIYSGTFNIPEEATYQSTTGSPEFKIVANTLWYGPASADDNANIITLTSGQELSNLPLLIIPSGPNWIFNSDWKGGDVTFTVNYDDMTLSLLYTEQTIEPEPDVDAAEITPKEPFTVTKTAPLWVYETSEEVENFYLEVADMEYDMFEVSTFGSYLSFSENPDGSEPVNLNYVESKNASIFTGESLKPNTKYYVVYLYGGKEEDFEYENTDYSVTLYLEEYVAPEAAPSITLEEEFTVSSDESEYTYFSLREEGNESEDLYFYLVTNSDTDLLKENGEFAIISPYGFDIFGEYGDVEAYLTDNGYVYANIKMDELETYTFTYTGQDEITMTLYQGIYTPEGATEYMGFADLLTEEVLVDPNSAIEISWGVDVTLVDEDAVKIPVYYISNGSDEPVGELTATYLQFQPTGDNNPSIDDPVYPGDDDIAVQAETGDNGNVLFILSGASDLFTQPGNYLLVIPEGIVANADGAVNKAQEVSVTFISLVEGEVDAENEYAEGDDVIFTITYADDVEKNEDATLVAILTDSNESMENYYDWETLEAGNMIKIEGDKVTVNLGNELPVGYYVFYFCQGAVTVNGDGNAEVVVNFTVGDPTGINSLYNFEGVEGIYNLQGVKVQNPAKGGIYIINGKKVLIK